MKDKKRKAGGAWQRKVLALAVASCFAGEFAQAAPSGGQFAHGGGTIVHQGNTTTVTNSPGSVINWNSFGIAANESVRFLQQSAASAVLNRVTGVAPSSILGNLQSNGRVFLINPNGITIGKGAVIDVAGFAASGLNLSDKDFQAGRHRFTETAGAGTVVNRGEIRTSSGGMVYLVGRNVQNHGVIRTPKGEIVLAAGRTIELVDAGTPEIRVQIKAPDNEVLNLGHLFASGGHIGMYAGLIRHGGTASANTAVVGENGRIVFKAVKDVKLEAGSVTTASGPTAGSIKVEAQTGTAVIAGTVEANATTAPGGTVDISGQQGVTIEPTGRISAAGIDGGAIALTSSAGPVEVAGQVTANATNGRGGRVAIEAATQATVAASAQVSASASRNGGSVRINGGEGAKLESGSTVEASGATGGLVTVAAERGPVEINGTIEATGSISTGGTIKVAALSDITLGDNSILNVSGRRGGETRIEAREGTTLASGLIDAYGHDGHGGKVLLLGPRVALFRNGTINASGLTGGGVVLVGGDFQGKNPDIQNAERTHVGPDARITADAIEAGNGGKVIIWADGDTQFYGNISARGGRSGGDGGFVEVSGKEYLVYAGRVSTLAPRGRTGTLLLDPSDLDIVATGDVNIDTGTPFTFTPDGDGGSTLGWDTITGPAGLGSNNVIVTTVGSPDVGGETGRIRIQAAGNYDSTRSLTFAAAAGIEINASVTNDGSGAINFTAADSISIAANVTTGGNIAMTATGGSITRTGAVTLTGALIDLTAATGIGTLADPILTTASSLSATTTGTAAPIHIAETDGLTALTVRVQHSDANVTWNAAADSLAFDSGANALTVSAPTAGTDVSFETTGGSISVNAVDVGSNAATVKASGTIGQTGAIVAGVLTTSSDGGTVLNDAGNAVAGLNATNTTSGTIEFTNSQALDIAGIDNGARAVTLTVDGAISQSGAIVAGALATSSDGGTVLNDAGNTVTGLNATNTTSGAIEFTNSQALDVAGIDNGARAVTLTVDGAISQTGAIVAGLLTTSSDGGTVLNDTGNTVTDLNATNITSGAIEFTNSQALDVAGIDNGARAVTLAVDGAISQSGAIVAGVLTTSSDGGTVLNDAGNAVTGLNATNTTSGTIEFTNSQALDIAGIDNGARAVTLTVDGAISQSGAIVAGALTTISDGGTVLDHIGNTVTSLDATNTTSGAIEFTNSQALDVAGIDNGARAVTLTVDGAISQSGAIVAGALTTSSEGGTVLNDTGNTVTGLDATNITSGAIEFTNSQALDVAGIDNGARAVTLTVDGAISQTGAIAAGLLTTSSVGGTVLNDTGNTVASLDATNTGSGNIELTNSATPLTVTNISQTGGGDVVIDNTGALVVDGTVSVTGGDLTLISSGSVTDAVGASITVTGNASFTGTSISLADNATDVLSVSGTASFDGGAGNVTVAAAGTVNFGSLTFNTTGGAVSIREDSGTQLTGTSTAGSLTLVSGGALTDAGGASVTVTGTTSLNAGASNITLDNVANDFGGPVTVVSANNLTLDDANALVLAAINITGNAQLEAGGTVTFQGVADIGGNLTVNSIANGGAGAAIIDTGAGQLLVTGTTSLTAGTGSITLDNSASDYGGSVTVVSAGNLTLDDTNTLTLVGISAAGNTTFDAGGAVTFTGVTNIGGNLTVNSIANGGTGFAIADTGAGQLLVTGTTSLTAGTAPIALNNTANDFGGAVSVISATNVTLEDTTGLSVGVINATGDAIFNAGGAVDFTGVATIGGNLTVNSIANGGAGAVIADTGAGQLLVTGTTSLTAGTGSITLNNPNNNYTGAVTVVSANDVALDDTNALTLAGVSATGDVTIDAGGAVTFTGLASVGGNLGVNSIANGGTGAVINGGAGQLNVTGTTNLTAGTGSITLNNPNNNYTGAVTVVSANDVTLDDTNALTLAGVSATGDVTIDAGGAVTFTGLASVGGNLTVNSIANGGTGAGINGGAGQLNVTGTTNLTAGTGSIVLDNANNFVGAVTIQGANDVSLRDANNLVLGNVVANGTLTLEAPGNVSQPGSTISAASLLLLGTGDYVLNSAGNAVGTIDANGPSSVSYRDSNGLTVGPVDGVAGMNVAGDVQLTTLGGGALNINAAMNVAGDLQLTTVGGGVLTINQPITTTADGNITLNNSVDLNINATITADGNVVQNGVGTTVLNSNIFTSEDLVEFGQHVLLSGNRSIDTSTNVGNGAGGTIRFLSTLDGGGNSLTMITPGTTGDVQINGLAENLAALTISNARNVSLQSVETLGAVNITAQGTATLGGALTSGGQVALQVDDLALTGSINAGANAVQVRSATLGQQIRLGSAGADPNGTILHISNEELNRINTSGLLTIGRATHTGGITVAGAINPTNATGGFTLLNRVGDIVVNAPVTYTAGAGNLTLTANGGGSTQGSITNNSNGLLTATNLRLNAAEGIGAAGSPLHVTGTNLRVDNTTSGGVFIEVPTGDLNLLALDNGGPGRVSLTIASGSIAVGGSGIDAAGNVELTTINGGIAVAGSGIDAAGRVELTATNGSIAVGGSGIDAAGNVELTTTNGGIAVAGSGIDAAGRVELTTTNGSIVVGGLGINAAAAVELTANATDGTPRTIDVNSPVRGNGRVILRAADDILIDALVQSGGGDIYIIAGNAPGMINPDMPVMPASEPAELSPDGGVAISARIDASNPAGPGGKIVINATESVIQNPAGAGGSAGLNNLGTTANGALVVRTYNDTPGGAIIDLRHDNNPNGNANGPVTLETRFANDLTTPNEPASYAASNIDYRSYTGVVLSGIGTSADFTAIAATQNIDLNALNIQAKNLTLIANDGDVNVNTQIANSQINSGNAGGSLNLLASGNVNVNYVAGTKGITIGRLTPIANTNNNPADPDYSTYFDPNTGLPKPNAIEKFDHNLKLVAENDIKIEGSVYLAGDLRLRADASHAEATTVGGAVGYGGGVGSVIIQALNPDPVVVSATNIMVGAMDASNRPLPVQHLTITAGDALPGAGGRQSASAILEAANKLEIFLTGDLTLKAGRADASNTGLPTSTVENSANAIIAGYTVDIRGLKNSDHPGIPMVNNTNIILRGGEARASETGGNLGVANADASAVVLAGQGARIDIGGDFWIDGGKADADGMAMTARAIAGTAIGTAITGTELLTVSVRDMYIGGGTGDSQNGGLADGFGRLASSGAIRINVSGDEGLVLVGAAGIGLFDALGTSLVEVTGRSYPVTVSNPAIQKRAGYTIEFDLLGAPSMVAPADPNAPIPVVRQDGLVVAGAPLVDESLLAAFLRATEAAREDSLSQDTNLPGRDSKSPAGVCK